MWRNGWENWIFHTPCPSIYNDKTTSFVSPTEADAWVNTLIKSPKRWTPLKIWTALKYFSAPVDYELKSRDFPFFILWFFTISISFSLRPTFLFPFLPFPSLSPPPLIPPVRRLVSFMVHRSIRWELGAVQKDPEGRFLFIQAWIDCQSHVLISLHLPPPASISILYDADRFAATFPHRNS